MKEKLLRPALGSIPAPEKRGMGRREREEERGEERKKTRGEERKRNSAI